MKTISLLFLILAVLSSCEVEQNTPTKPATNGFDESTATLVGQGVLMGIGGHTASGTASVYESNGQFVVVLDPYSSQNGPDLKVYLSKDANASAYLNLGPLKSTTGKQSYAVTTTVNINDYTHVHIWCERYSVEFARAEVK